MINDGPTFKGELNLCDLAGSERLPGQAGAALKPTTARETKGINSSLSSLGVVLNSLGKGEQHIPYRNSKLTYLLANALGADTTQACKTMVILNVSPCTLATGEGGAAAAVAASHDKTKVAETVSSINFDDSIMFFWLQVQPYCSSYRSCYR